MNNCIPNISTDDAAMMRLLGYTARTNGGHASTGKQIDAEYHLHRGTDRTLCGDFRYAFSECAVSGTMQICGACLSAYRSSRRGSLR